MNRNNFHMTRKVLFLVVLLMSGMVSVLAKKTTIVISCDGFRWDYSEMYDTPFLDLMARQGVKGELVPSFPSKTFPNHYTLATGLRPEHHGIIANSFLNRATGARFSLSNPKTKYDARFYHGEPLCLHTAVFYWPGSDVAIDGHYPDLWHSYDEKPHLTFTQRVDGIMQQLTAKKSPDLIMAYFEEPDASGHSYGPQAKQTRAAVENIDSLLGSLWTRIGKAGLQDQVNLVVVSDHGMAWFTPSRQITVGRYLHKDWYQSIEGNLPANIYAAQRWQQDSIVAALSHVAHLHVWRKADIPQWLHYQSDPNIGDVLVLPDEGFLFTDETCHDGGVHGFDPAYSDMHALFRAMGPDVRVGENIGAFSNTAVYALVCRLLGISPAPNDGMEDYRRIAIKMFKDGKTQH